MKLNGKFGSITLLLSTTLILGACSTAAMVESAYPGRAKYLHTDGDGTTYSYLCKKKASDQETAKQSTAAHAYVTQKTLEIAKKTIGSMMEKELGKDEKPSFFSFMGSYMGASMEMNRQAKKLGPEIDKKFGCLLLEVDE